MSNSRSILRVRVVPHIHPNRRNETIVEVMRDGEVVAYIYGSREGLHIVSERQPHNRAFVVDDPKLFRQPGWSVTLLAQGETCPWCQGIKIIDMGRGPIPCPVCGVVA